MPMDPDVPQILTRTVDYCFRQYTEADNFAVPGSSAASDIREQIESGSLVADGTQVYEGRELLKYQEVMPEEPELTDLGWLLIDPETYRPVFRVGYPGSSAEYTMVIEFLPAPPRTWPSSSRRSRPASRRSTSCGATASGRRWLLPLTCGDARPRSETLVRRRPGPARPAGGARSDRGTRTWSDRSQASSSQQRTAHPSRRSTR